MSFELPKLYPITDRRLSGLSHAEQVARLCDGGARVVQLREKRLSPREFYREAEEALGVARARGAKLIINSQTGQWGTDYDVKRDFARLDLTKTNLPQPVDQFTIAVVPQGGGGLLRMSWDTTQYSIPFTIK